ncbi:hypothetical protein, partial [Okeania sp. SIO2G5]|uniref:hypothetical protein n=1 Tax=Okeania sp. SIO2G5 TaxID=2607796 RepID=UPI00257EB96A
LLWLVLCLVLVIFDWGYDVSTSAGRSARSWWEGISKSDSNDIATETGKQLVEASKASLSSTISQARSQLGLPDKPAASSASASNGALKPAPAPAKPTAPTTTSSSVTE